MSLEIIKYNTGEVLCEKNVTDDSRFFGKAKVTWFNKQGDIQCEESYVNNEKDGKCTYYKNGKIFCEGTYSQGYKEDIWVETDEESGTRTETNYDDGLKNGLEVTHLKDGRKLEIIYENGIDTKSYIYKGNAITKDLHPRRIEKLDFIFNYDWGLIERDEIQDNLHGLSTKGNTDSKIEKDQYYNYIKYYDIAVYGDIMRNPLNYITEDIISETGGRESISWGPSHQTNYGFGPYYLEDWFLYKNLQYFGKYDYFVLFQCSLDSGNRTIQKFMKDYFPRLFSNINWFKLTGSDGQELLDF